MPGFFAGTSHFCPDGTCVLLRNEPCRYPSKVPYSLEAFGFDLGRTAAELLQLPVKRSEKEEWPDSFLWIRALRVPSQTDFPGFEGIGEELASVFSL